MPKKKKPTVKETVAVDKLDVSDLSYGVVVYRMTYVWSERSTNSKVLRIVVQGAILQILSEEDNDWMRVKTVEENPVEGYIRSTFVGKPED